MELTTKGFKKPTTGDANDLYQFVGDNMDLLETELDKKSNSNHSHSELHTHSNKAILDATEASYTILEKNKLSGIESGANVNQNAFSNVKVGTDLLTADSVTDTLEIVAGNNVTIDSLNDMITISSKDTVYTHPSSHPASIIIQDENNRFMTDTERTKLAGIATGANNYVHPTTAGNKHIPTGGTTGNYLKYSSSGTALWATPTSAEITESATKKFVSDAQISDWDAKSNLTLGETSTTAYRGDRGKIAYDHSQVVHAPSNAQKNSDITKAEIEAKLTGNITTHTHNYNDLTGKPYFVGTSAPVNKNIFWVDTN